MAKTQKPKTDEVVDAGRVKLAIRSRFNPIRGLTPEILAQQLDEFEGGYLRRMALTMNTIEDRDDILKCVAPKRKKAVSRNDYDILLSEKSDRAEKHKEVLTDFYENLVVTSAADLNQRGGFPLLVRQMMDAVGKRYAVHEIIWKPGDGPLTAEMRFVPLWFFESTTGRLRYLRSDASISGEDLPEGEWMITVGDGVMIACSVAYMFKTLPLKDWLVYCDRSGNPGIRGKTQASRGSPEWNAMVEAVKNYATDFAAVMGADETIESVNIEAKGELPFPKMVDRMDRALSCLWRGADLSTLSGATSQGGQGASLQGDESNILEEDDCQLISETLNEQLDRWVIRYALGDETPLAYIQVKPRVKRNVTNDIATDTFLTTHGGKLPISDAMQRYGRRVAEADEEVLVPHAQPQQAGLPVASTGRPVPLMNERTPGNQDAEELLAVARIKLAEAQSQSLEALATPLLDIYRRIESGSLSPEAARAELIALRDKRLPEILKSMNADPETATVLEETMAAALVNGIAEGAEQTAGVKK
ncbi:MAG: DUF935 family protein [Lentisphaerota bacterium]